MIRRKRLERKTPLARIGKHAALAKAKGLRRSKTRKNYKKRLWEVFSEYIRKKYADHTGNVVCVTCGAVKHWKQIHAGHYIAKSMGSAIYFHEQNVHPQCVACNLWRRGNLTLYALFLRKTYGTEILEQLDALRREDVQLREAWYLEKIEYYREQAKQWTFPEAA